MDRCRSEIEVWKSIPGYEGLYEASNQGRIRTAFGKTTSSARFPKRVWTQRILKLKWKERKGHTGKYDARVCLWKDGIEHTHLVSRLVAMSFLPCPFEKLTVNHIDGDPSNNHVDNLEWVTTAENNRHAFETGLMTTQKAVVLIDGNSCETLRFPSMSSADKFLHRTNGYTSGAVATGRYCTSKDGKRYFATLDIGGDCPS